MIPGWLTTSIDMFVNGLTLSACGICFPVCSTLAISSNMVTWHWQSNNAWWRRMPEINKLNHNWQSNWIWLCKNGYCATICPLFPHSITSIKISEMNGKSSTRSQTEIVLACMGPSYYRQLVRRQGQWLLNSAHIPQVWEPLSLI